MWDFPRKNWIFEDILNQMPKMRDENVISEQQTGCDLSAKICCQKKDDRQDRNEFETTLKSKKRLSPGFTLHNWNPSMIPNMGQWWPVSPSLGPGQ